MRGQRRLHFAKESDQRRRAILSALQAAQVHGTAYQALERDDLTSRTLCLQAVFLDAIRLGVTRIVLEQDDSIVPHDRQVLFTALHRAARTDITYDHARAATEPLLALPDAIARGGDWRRRVNPMIDSLQRLP